LDELARNEVRRLSELDTPTVATLLEVAAAQSVLALALLKHQQAERRVASKAGAPDTWLTATQAAEVAQLSPRFFYRHSICNCALLPPRAQQQRAHVRPAREPSTTAHLEEMTGCLAGCASNFLAQASGANLFSKAGGDAHHEKATINPASARLLPAWPADVGGPTGKIRKRHGCSSCWRRAHLCWSSQRSVR
jgi:hypothetical protein